MGIQNLSTSLSDKFRFYFFSLFMNLFVRAKKCILCREKKNSQKLEKIKYPKVKIL
jgi:hypothetical protein